MSHETPFTLCLAVVLCLLSAPVLAADGAIPIWEPTAITEPGRYVLTRDLAADSLALVVQSDNVVVDPNDFRIQCVDPDGEACINIETGHENITIENGIVQSRATYGHGIEVYTSSSELHRITIRNNVITAANEAITGGPGLHGTIVRNNRILGLGSAGISLNGCSACEVRQNNLRHGGISITGHGSSVNGNTLRSTVGSGIDASGDSNCITSNIVTDAGDHALPVWGHNFLIEGNQLNANAGYGLNLSFDSHVYRGNTARGNNGTGCTGTASGNDFCDFGVNNSSHGDNYMPSQM